MILQVEVTLYRDLKPRSRPSYLQLDDTRIKERVYQKLFPGSGGNDGENLGVFIAWQGYVVQRWGILTAQFLVDGIPYSSPMPGELFTGPSDFPASMIHFLPMAPPEHPVFGGVHTLTLRTHTR